MSCSTKSKVKRNKSLKSSSCVQLVKGLLAFVACFCSKHTVRCLILYLFICLDSCFMLSHVTPTDMQPTSIQMIKKETDFDKSTHNGVWISCQILRYLSHCWHLKAKLDVTIPVSETQMERVKVCGLIYFTLKFLHSKNLYFVMITFLIASSVVNVSQICILLFFAFGIDFHVTLTLLGHCWNLEFKLDFLCNSPGFGYISLKRYSMVFSGCFFLLLHLLISSRLFQLWLPPLFLLFFGLPCLSWNQYFL